MMDITTQLLQMSSPWVLAQVEAAPPADTWVAYVVGMILAAAVVAINFLSAKRSHRD